MKLPNKYKILPYSLPFIVPGFTKTYREGDHVLSLREIETNKWFYEFINKIEEYSKDKKFLPICRMSDGEFMFCVGEKLPSERTGLLNRFLFSLRRKFSKVIKGNNFRANTLPSVPSGNYTQKERKSALMTYGQKIKLIAEQGILALDLTFWEEPFQEQYFPHFRNWLDENHIEINAHNYYPFYFVYAALLGEAKYKLITGKNILIIHSAIGLKRDKIISELYKIGADQIEWLEISADRSLYDKIDLAKITTIPQLVLIGAGVGKPNIILQLSSLCVPCIDAGYVFEVWHEEDNKWKRRYCVDDKEFNSNKILF
jgi:hypothetical protein